MLPDRATFDALVALAAESGARLLLDEVYRGLELDAADRLPAGADALDGGISLGVMSKAYAMAGLRIGWLASRDRELLGRVAAFKDYTTICSSAPSEVLAIMGLRAGDRVLARSRGIIAANLEVVDAFLEDWADRFSWVRPRAGSIGYPRLTVPGIRIDDWAAELVETEGVLLIPGSQFGHPGNHFRIGLRPDGPARGDRPPRGIRKEDPPMTIPARLGIVTLGVADLARSVAFYEALGWERCSVLDARGSPGSGPPTRTSACSRGTSWRPTRRLPAEPRARFGGITLAINVDAADEVAPALAAAVEAGGSLLKPRPSRTGAGRRATSPTPTGIPGRSPTTRASRSIRTGGCASPEEAHQLTVPSGRPR